MDVGGDPIKATSFNDICRDVLAMPVEICKERMKAAIIIVMFTMERLKWPSLSPAFLGSLWYDPCGKIMMDKCLEKAFVALWFAFCCLTIICGRFKNVS